MACSRQHGPAAFITFVEETTGERISQRDWHDLRKMAAADGYPMGKKAQPEDRNDEAVAALVASLNLQNESDTDDVKAALAGVENSEATLSVIDYLAKNGVEDTIAKVYEARGETPPNSRYDWEEGTLILPAAAVAPMKKALRDEANAFHAETLAAAKRLAKEAGTTSPAKFNEWLAAREAARYRSDSRAGHNPYDTAATLRAKQVEAVAEGFLADRLKAKSWKNIEAPKRVTVPTAAELEGYGVKKYTNKDTEFAVLDSDGYPAATISFKDRAVNWRVEENNRAVESAHAAPMARVFFGQLGKVKWTRGTGGTFAGNDEYNRDNYDTGGGANYTTQAFGPAGEEAQIWDYVRRGFSRKQASDIVRGGKK